MATKTTLVKNLNDFFYGSPGLSKHQVLGMTFAAFMVCGIWAAFIGVYGIFKIALTLLVA